MASKKTPVRATTQQHLDIADIRDDLVILKDGSVVLILTTTAVNFGLLSETEQDAIIYAYASLLNSLSFPVQISIRSQRMDISSYIKLLKNAENKQANQNLKLQIKKYRAFIEATIRENDVLDKNFYIILPFSSLELGAKSTGNSILKTLNPFTKKNASLPYSKKYILEKAKTNLYPKRDHILKQLQRLGLKGYQLTSQQLIELFYNIYNPENTGTQKMSSAARDYTAILVETAAV